MSEKGNSKDFDPRRFLPPLLVYGAVLVIVLLSLSEAVRPTKTRRTVDYSVFKDLVRNGAIQRVVISETELRGEAGLRTPESGASGDAASTPIVYVTTRIDDPSLVELLDSQGIPYAGRPKNPFGLAWVWWLLPVVLFVAFWRLIAQKTSSPGSAFGFGRSRARLITSEDVGVSFADVAGVDEAKEELQEVVEFLKDPSRFSGMGAQIPKGVLLVGPPGTGKTLLARAVAGEAGVPFFLLTGADFVEMFVGVGAARVRDMFAQAQSKAPCIIFIDELDAVGKARGSSIVANEEREQTLNQLLAEMDGFDPRKGVIIMGATNRPETIDLALLRPGRFDRQILVDRPDLEGRHAILKVHARKIRVAPEVDLRAVAASTPGFAGAELANVLNEAALLAVRRNRKAVGMTELRDAIERIIAGLAKKNRLINPEEKRRIAHHEAGHALVGARVSPSAPVSKISIVPHGIGALGFTLQMPLEDRYLMTREQLRDKLAILLAGRAAEELCLGSVSTGASDDLRRATDIASRMLREYGMSERLGPQSFEDVPVSLSPGARPGAAGLPYGEKTAEALDEERKKLIEDAHRRALEVLGRERAALERLSKALLERETLEGAELARLLAPTVVELRVAHPAPSERRGEGKSGEAS